MLRVYEVPIGERLGVEALGRAIMNFESYGIEEYDFLVTTLERGEYWFKPKKVGLDMKHRESLPATPSIKEAQI